MGLSYDFVVYFIYGLAFFGLGLAMALEAGRSPALGEARVLRPLAVFGLLHGLHEWVELFILEAGRLGLEPTPVLSWLRLALLGLSFVSLIAYGVQVLKPQTRGLPADVLVAGASLGVYMLVALLVAAGPAAEVGARADALARYLLAVPGAALAAVALRRHAQQMNRQGRMDLARRLGWASWGFAAYGLSQLFVPPTDLYLAGVLNTQTFSRLLGLPIQVPRAALATLITTSLIQAIQLVERERQAEFLTAQQARLQALERARRELEKREALQRDLLRHTVVAQEEERARIARELHDETAQALTAFSLNLAALKNMLPEGADALEVVGRLQQLSDQMAVDIYRLVRDLRPVQLDDLGLPPALAFLADQFLDQFGLRVSFEIQGRPRRQAPWVETVLFRVAQEALTNVVRHALVAQADLSLAFDQDQVRLSVKDAGIGFRANGDQGEGQGGWGLVGMRERIESLGGRFVLETAPGEGVRVEIAVPYQIWETVEVGDANHPVDAGR